MYALSIRSQDVRVGERSPTREKERDAVELLAVAVAVAVAGQWPLILRQSAARVTFRPR